MRISDLKAGTKNVSLDAEIGSIEAPREINKEGRVLRVRQGTEVAPIIENFMP